VTSSPSARLFAHATCTASPERASRLRDVVLEHLPRNRPVTILDVGCGAGTLVFQLAEAFPLARVVGVDISPANIRAAETAPAGQRDADRVRFVEGDYLEQAMDPADAIVSDTALHFIGGGAERLWGKLSRDLRPSGILVCCMAYDGVYNRAVRSARRALRRVRSVPVDFMIRRIASLVHGGRMNDALLSERIEYMYIPPAQFMTPEIERILAPMLGLRPIGVADVPATSVTELRQRMTVFIKATADEKLR
jgi:SAM-dependent methyltransferase